MSKKWRNLIAYILQSMSWVAGILVAIKELIPKPVPITKSFPLPTEPPTSINYTSIIVIAVVILIVVTGLEYWRTRE